MKPHCRRRPLLLDHSSRPARESELAPRVVLTEIRLVASRRSLFDDSDTKTHFVYIVLYTIVESVYDSSMIASYQEIYSILCEYNPWWGRVVDSWAPTWSRSAFREIHDWLIAPPSPRALLISGARQVGKTTLLRQAVRSIIESGVDPEQVLYVTFDHPLLKLTGLAGVVKIWEEMHTRNVGRPEFLLLDEIQYTSDWQTWIKHQVDFNKGRRIAVTGSAMPLNSEHPESGVGRRHTIKLPTLSFYEYLKIKGIEFPELQEVKSLRQIFSWSDAERIQAGAKARPLVSHFHEYLMRGGFPETAMIDDISIAQKLIREDIVDKVLKRDMTALYGVRHVLDLEKLFLYLCLHDGGILDIKKIGENLEMNRTVINNFLALLESAHLIYRLQPHGYGKQVLKGQHKVYLSDAAIAGSVLLRGRSLLQDSAKLGAAVETVFFKHIFARLYPMTIAFSYWRDAKSQLEVDFIAETTDALVPFEVKYTSRVQGDDLRGMQRFCEQKSIDWAYVITRELTDFRVVTKANTKLLQIPAALACYWLSRSELG